MTHPTLRSCLIASATISLFACGGGDKAANTGQPPPVQCPPGQIFDGRYCQMAAPQPSPSSVPSAAPSAAPAPSIVTAATGAPAQPIDASAAALVTVALAPLAKQSAPGAKPVGTPSAAMFQQGQVLETLVQMKPGKCYTVVGAAVPTVQNLDIQLAPVMPLGLASPVAAEDKTQASTAVVAPAPNCFKWSELLGSGTMKVIMRVSAGQGLAAMQVYEK